MFKYKELGGGEFGLETEPWGHCVVCFERWHDDDPMTLVCEACLCYAHMTCGQMITPEKGYWQCRNCLEGRLRD